MYKMKDTSGNTYLMNIGKTTVTRSYKATTRSTILQELTTGLARPVVVPPRTYK